MIFKNKNIIVLGDSHVSVFRSDLIKSIFPETEFKVVNVNGATASGLENPNSITKAYTVFNDAIKDDNESRIIIMLGEVDTGFVIWYRSQKYNIPIENSLEITVKTYFSFIQSIKNPERLIIISAPLPTIKDGQDWGEVANLRKEINATQKERTDLTILFNSTIESMCLKSSIKFLNLDPYIIGSDGLIKKQFFSKNRLNHHYNRVHFSRLLAQHLQPLL